MDEMKTDEMDGSCSTLGRDEKCFQRFKSKYNLKQLDIKTKGMKT
jgi:hypothetical protein